MIAVQYGDELLGCDGLFSAALGLNVEYVKQCAVAEFHSNVETFSVTASQFVRGLVLILPPTNNMLDDIRVRCCCLCTVSMRLHARSPSPRLSQLGSYTRHVALRRGLQP